MNYIKTSCLLVLMFLSASVFANPKEDLSDSGPAAPGEVIEISQHHDMMSRCDFNKQIVMYGGRFICVQK